MNKHSEEFVSSLEKLLYEGNRPDLLLGETGELPPKWEDQYLALLSENRNYWQNLDTWPRPLLYSFYRVGFHFTMAYTGWCEKNGKNPITEASLQRIRIFTESFLVGKPSDVWELET